MGHGMRVLAGGIAVLRRLRGMDGEPVRLFVRHAGAGVGVAPVTLYGDENVAGWYGPIGQWETRALVGIDIALGERVSRGGALAYVETNYYGGAGYQAAALWRDGALLFGLDVEVPKAPPYVPPPGFLARLFGRVSPIPPPAPPGPVSRALEGLGIAGDASGDAFVTFGLGGLRSNEDLLTDWVELSPPDQGPDQPSDRP